VTSFLKKAERQVSEKVERGAEEWRAVQRSFVFRRERKRGTGRGGVGHA